MLTAALQGVAFGINFCGAVTNGISLSFFLKQRQNHLGNKLLASLNIADMVVCANGIVYFILRWITHAYYLEDTKALGLSHRIREGMFRFVTEMSGLMTVFLSVVRTLSMVYPLRRAAPRIVYGTYSFIMLYIAFSTIACNILSVKSVEVFYEIEHETRIAMSCDFSKLKTLTAQLYEVSQNVEGLVFYLAPCIEISIMVVVVAVSSAVGVLKLLKTDPALGGNQRNGPNSRAIVTVMILSLLFMVFNTVWVALRIVPWSQMEDLLVPSGSCADWESYFAFFENVTLGYFIIPLNSAINPVVYMVRKEGLRRYVRDGARGVKERLFRFVGFRSPTVRVEEVECNAMVGTAVMTGASTRSDEVIVVEKY